MVAFRNLANAPKNIKHLCTNDGAAEVQGDGHKRHALLTAYYEIQPNSDKVNVYTKFYSHQLMHFFIQLCISLLSYIKIT